MAGIPGRRSTGKRDSKTQPEAPEDTFEAHSFLPAFFIFLVGSKCQDDAKKKKGATGEDPINLAHLLDQHLCSV